MANVLVVEDGESLRDVLALTLHALGHQVRCAQDGAEGWAWFQVEEFDLVLTDVDMPVLDGIQLLGVLRRARPAQRVAVMSGEPRHGPRALARGAEAFLVKPFAVRDLEALLAGPPAREPTPLLEPASLLETAR